MTCKLDREPLSLFATMAESEIQTLLEEADNPVLNLVQESAYANPVPETVTYAETDSATFVMRMEDTRAWSKVIATSTV